MEPEMRAALRRAGIKAGVGLSLIAAVLGVRIVTADPDGVEAEVAELESVELAEADVEDPEASSEGPVLDPGSTASMERGMERESLADRLGRGVRERLPGAEPAPRAGDRLVECRIRGGTQFMRADDCALRGGRARDVDR